MPCANTPALETPRLILRRFVPADLEDLLLLYGDPQVNTFLPWFPLSTLEEARTLYQARYAAAYQAPRGYRYAVCLREDNRPIGYVHLSMEESHDLGYALRREFWHRGLTTEAAQAVIARAQADGLPYVTATHDIHNPRSGGVMRRLGMTYRYTYQELWQPKNFPVLFRMYQRNLDGQEGRVYRAYWEQASLRYVEEGI